MSVVKTQKRQKKILNFPLSEETVENWSELVKKSYQEEAYDWALREIKELPELKTINLSMRDYVDKYNAHLSFFANKERDDIIARVYWPFLNQEKYVRVGNPEKVFYLWGDIAEQLLRNGEYAYLTSNFPELAKRKFE